MIAGILDSIRRGCFYCSCAAPQQAFAQHHVIALLRRNIYLRRQSLKEFTFEDSSFMVI